jgi:hypothetical protein
MTTNASVTPQQVAKLVHAYRHHVRWTVVHTALLILFAGLFFTSQWEYSGWWLRTAYCITIALFADQMVDALRGLGALEIMGKSATNLDRQ